MFKFEIFFQNNIYENMVIMLTLKVDTSEAGHWEPSPHFKPGIHFFLIKLYSVFIVKFMHICYSHKKIIRLNLKLNTYTKWVARF